MTNEPPDGLPRYRLLTGPDDETFCRRVSEALDLGYRLHGGPALTFDGERVIAAQALLWPYPATEELALPGGAGHSDALPTIESGFGHPA